jgi:antitoxin component YwqK of YwqJK toxin-antitoxin module
MSPQIKYLIYLLVLGFFYACENGRTVKEYYSNGNIKFIKTFAPNEELAKLERFDSIDGSCQVFFYSNNEIDSLIGYDTDEIKIFKKEIISKRLFQTNFYKNGNVESKGFLINDTLKNDWWDYFNIDGKLKSKREYVLVCDDYYLNQSIVFDQKGDTIFTKDDFNETIFFKYKIIENKKDIMTYEISPVSYRSKLELVFLRENNFCKEEGNIDSIVPLENRKGTITLDKIKKPFSGFVFDYYIDTTFVQGKRKINSISRKIYFNSTPERDKQKVPPRLIL